MMKNKYYLFACVFMALLLAGENAVFAASKSDLSKEKRWAEQIVPSLMDGEAIKLNAMGVEFLGLFTRATTEKAKGAVVLIHGRGAHPAWPEVIEPLRVQLPELGWHTLSIQMPVLRNEAEDKDYVPLMPEVPARIQAGVDYLEKMGINKIVISGHSTGAAMASYFLAMRYDPNIKAFVMISGGPGVPHDKRMDSLENFKKIKGISIVDIRGGNDQKRIMDVVNKRTEVAKVFHKHEYSSLVIPGADHFYRNREDSLVSTIGNWLNNNL